MAAYTADVQKRERIQLGFQPKTFHYKIDTTSCMLLPRDGHIIPEYISVGYDIIHVTVCIQHGGAGKYIDKLPAGGLCGVYVMLQCNKRNE